MVFDKMTAICPDYKGLGFQISDYIPNPDHLQSNLFCPFEIQTRSDPECKEVLMEKIISKN